MTTTINNNIFKIQLIRLLKKRCKETSICRRSKALSIMRLTSRMIHDPIKYISKAEITAVIIRGAQAMAEEIKLFQCSWTSFNAKLFIVIFY
ncbi:hypothetical protein SPHINGO8BC_60260 [Sphingobacterium multivorum]|uniref:Uncharacterized protein n=1 Tax=Sphingobacterium multivorum TaxID=28454 RepID=A0A654DGA7_SPHMU|nr:hypothetical protein SPHINGO8BC_60260 [Sphingobacterium multivorum]